MFFQIAQETILSLINNIHEKNNSPTLFTFELILSEDFAMYVQYHI